MRSKRRVSISTWPRYRVNNYRPNKFAKLSLIVSYMHLLCKASYVLFFSVLSNCRIFATTSKCLNV
jgi:hypothetical protein